MPKKFPRLQRDLAWALAAIVGIAAVVGASVAAVVDWTIHRHRRA